jgi:hypothetical protein
MTLLFALSVVLHTTELAMTSLVIAVLRTSTLMDFPLIKQLMMMKAMTKTAQKPPLSALTAKRKIQKSFFIVSNVVCRL